MAESVSPSVVAVEIVSGDGITLAQAAALLPAGRGEGCASQSGVWRWATVGSKAVDGRTVKLEVAKFGGRFLTSRAALARFSAALTAAPDTTQTPTTTTRTAVERQRADRDAAKRLAASGA